MRDKEKKMMKERWYGYKAEGCFGFDVDVDEEERGSGQCVGI